LKKLEKRMQSKKKLHLKDVLTPEVIRIGVSVEDREQAIRKAGELLVENQIAEPRYIDAMVATCDELGPYIVLAPGVAIPHAAPEKGAMNVGLALITLKEPIKFGNDQNDPVNTVIAFASCDEEMHMGILSQLALFLEDLERLEAVAHAKTPEEVIKLIGA
jgi:mannitol/fructose-specific phosphotransferase system IIA component (Ntr-type)